MQFQALTIINFRAIRKFKVENLTDLIVIAGPNGSGKSCVFDALRLLKSQYGGYQNNELQQWFSEFTLDYAAPQKSLPQILRDKTSPATIEAVLVISADERSYIRENLSRLCLIWSWSRHLGKQMDELGGFEPEGLAMQYPDRQESVQQVAESVRASVETETNLPSCTLKLIVTPDGQVNLTQCLVASLIFQTYESDHLGILDYHSAYRSYQREGIGSLSLSTPSTANRAAMALYNASSKYQGIKAEIANSYIRRLVRDASGTLEDDADNIDLSESLAELFRTFFPDKSFAGVTPQPDGTVTFPVNLSGGGQHDINELSSGEKEVLYGYLRLRNQTPRHSIILIDEPELHLNPRIITNLPDFYHRHLCLPYDNQIWMVTHSDAMLRQSVADPTFTVIHMTSATVTDIDTNQAATVTESDLDAAIFALVGDISTYKPLGKVVVLEGGGGTDFDVSLVRRLFPDVDARINLVSGSSKGRVRDLYRILSETAEQTAIADRFYAITDRDSEEADDQLRVSHVFKWPVYHIENFLMEKKYVAQATNYLSIKLDRVTEADVLERLKACAEETLDSLVAERLSHQLNQMVIRAVTVKCSPDSKAPAVDLQPSIARTYERLEQVRVQLTDSTFVATQEQTLRDALGIQLSNGTFLQEFPGRKLLKRYVHLHCDQHVDYMGFVALIVNAMVADGYRPPGMDGVLQAVLDAPVDS